ncbi:MAG: hypothetical protein ABIG95_06980 [Candidatus Woesearchaeota archaeon]
MFKKRKAQAAMEFLMTYGWAILVVLVVIGALAYFGVLNPQRLLPPRCTFPTGLTCRDYVVHENSSNMIISLSNAMGKSINIVSVIANGTAGNNIHCNAGAYADVIVNGKNFDATLTCTGFYAGISKDYDTKYRWDIIISWYYNDTGATYTRRTAGELFTGIEP